MGITMIAWDTRACKSVSAFSDDTNVHKLWIDGTNPLADVCTAIGMHASGSKISVLRIYGHGITHNGQGVGVQFGKENISAESLASFVSLQGRFEPGGRIELRSCKAGKGADQGWTSTWAIFTALAALTGAFVYAAEEIQTGGGWIEPTRSSTQWTSKTAYENEQKQQMSLQTVGDVFVISPFIGEPVKRLRPGDTTLTSGGAGQVSGSGGP